MPLLNAFIDSIVCVGFNSERGLVTDRQSEENVQPLLSYLQPYVLAILTTDQAAYPEPGGKFNIDPSYPFIPPCKSSTGDPSNSKPPKKQVVSNTFSNLPLFCSPDGVKISQIEESPIHHIVFTQEEGKRSYAVVLAIPQKFILKSDKPDEDGTYQIEPVISNPTQTKKHSSRKIPSAYRHTTTIIHSISNAQSYTSSNTAPRRPLQNTLSNNTESTGQSTQSFDESESRNNSNTHSSMGGGKLTSGSRSRSISNLSLSSKSLNRSTSSLAFDPTQPFYLPHFVVLISSQPYWTAMHEVISAISINIREKKIEPSSETYKILMQKYAFFACNIPIPPIAWERFSLSFNLNNDGSVITLDPPTHTNRPVLDLDLSILLVTLETDKLIQVLAALLTQQAIIFFSVDYSRLVTTLECLLYLIYPLKWIHTYIPLVPHSLRDYCLAGPPGSYIMGVHSRDQFVVEELDSCFTCNLDDKKNIHIPSNVEFSPIPSAKLRRFSTPIDECVKEIKYKCSIQNIHTTVSVHEHEQRESERRQRLDTNNKISEIFLDLMVDLCNDTLKTIFWKVDHQQSSSTNSLQRSLGAEQRNTAHNQTRFSKEKYLLSKKEDDEREFYRIFISTTAFELFLEEEKTSTTPTEFRKICQLRSQVNHDQPYHFNAASTDKRLKPTLSSFDSTSTQMLLSLPEWPGDVSTHYLDCCIKVFTSELGHAQQERSSPIISIYAYLRGCALIARGHLLQGLEDLYLIENVNLFPKDYIQTTVVPLLSDVSLLDHFRQESFYLKAVEWKQIPDEPEGSRKSSTSSADFPPLPPNSIEGDVSFEKFHDYVQQSSIVNDRETSEILFKALVHWANAAKKPVGTTRPLRRWSLGGSTYKEPPTTLQMGNQTIDFSLKSSLPAKLFELFLEIWQRTNAEKARMNHYLPEDRQKQESILMISSTDIISKTHGRGKLILTQRGLYLLPEGRTSASLISELLKIVLMDLYQHKTIFAASKPAVRIYALYSPSASAGSSSDGEPLDMLQFKDNQEQNFWYKAISELWSGVSIAQVECDTTVLHKVFRHIDLMDTLANIDYNESTDDKRIKQGNNQICLDLALNDFAVFTRMQKNGTFKRITNETRHALHNRLTPSINENESYAVRCLVFAESPDSSDSLLWCAYGMKLKIFNSKTWICDPNELSFPSVIKCMCLDASNRLWIGCAGGQLFIVDIIRRICGTQLASIEGKHGCQTMAFDSTRHQMLIANRAGLLMIWNTINRQYLTNINLNDMYKNISNMQQKIFKTEMLLNLRPPTEEQSMTASPIKPGEQIPNTPNALKTIQVYEDLLFACYCDDYILIFRANTTNTYTYDQIVSVRYTDTIPINCFLVYNHKLWISACYIIYVYKINTKHKKNSYDLVMKNHLDDDHLLTMIGVPDYIWAGSSRGNVYVFRTDNYERFKTFNGHKDAVFSLCSMLNRYIISGSGQADTSIVIWENIKTKNLVTTTQF